MRPTRHRQSPLETPLNEILGRESQVRVLRVLSLSRDYLPVTDLASLTKLDASGIRRVVTALVHTGILEYESPSGNSVRLRATYWLGENLRKLFHAERDNAQRIETGIQNSLAQITPPPIAAWVGYSEVADSSGIQVGILADRRYLENMLDSLRRMILDVVVGQSTFVTVSGLTLEDLQGLDSETLKSLSMAKPLLGIHPISFLSARSGPRRVNRNSDKRTHEIRDREGLELAKAIAEKILRDPSLINRAKRNIESRLRIASERETHDLRAWYDMLTKASPSQLARFLTDSSELAVRLRQSLPFTGLLSAEDLAAIRTRIPHK